MLFKDNFLDEKHLGCQIHENNHVCDAIYTGDILKCKLREGVKKWVFNGQADRKGGSPPPGLTVSVL